MASRKLPSKWGRSHAISWPPTYARPYRNIWDLFFYRLVSTKILFSKYQTSRPHGCIEFPSILASSVLGDVRESSSLCSSMWLWWLVRTLLAVFIINNKLNSWRRKLFLSFSVHYQQQQQTQLLKEETVSFFQCSLLTSTTNSTLEGGNCFLLACLHLAGQAPLFQSCRPRSAECYSCCNNLQFLPSCTPFDFLDHHRQVWALEHRQNFGHLVSAHYNDCSECFAKCEHAKKCSYSVHAQKKTLEREAWHGYKQTPRTPSIARKMW